MSLAIENLNTYKFAVALNRRFAKIHPWPSGRAHLRDQGLRAVDSVVLNIAEGMGRGRTTKAANNHFRIARGSLLEVYAVVDILNLGDDLKQDIRRIDSMLFGLGR